jgi:hypothetical protein
MSAAPEAIRCDAPFQCHWDVSYTICAMNDDRRTYGAPSRDRTELKKPFERGVILSHED